MLRKRRTITRARGGFPREILSSLMMKPAAQAVREVRHVLEAAIISRLVGGRQWHRRGHPPSSVHEGFSKELLEAIKCAPNGSLRVRHPPLRAARSRAPRELEGSHASRPSCRACPWLYIDGGQLPPRGRAERRVRERLQHGARVRPAACFPVWVRGERKREGKGRERRRGGEKKRGPLAFFVLLKSNQVTPRTRRANNSFLKRSFAHFILDSVSARENFPGGCAPGPPLLLGGFAPQTPRVIPSNPRGVFWGFCVNP